jgi:hypothetical protein
MSAAHRSFLSIGYLIGVFVAALLATSGAVTRGEVSMQSGTGNLML